MREEEEDQGKRGRRWSKENSICQAKDFPPAGLIGSSSPSTYSIVNLCDALLSIHRSHPIIISSTTTTTTTTSTATGTTTTTTTTTTNQRPTNHHHRRASVAIIIRISPDSHHPIISSPQQNSPSISSPSSPSSNSNYQDQPISSSSSSSSSPSSSPDSPLPGSESSSESASSVSWDVSNQLINFFSQSWVQTGTPEILFIERNSHRSSNSPPSAHLAFPGGRMEPEDEDGLFCAMRETWEEVGIDLAEPEFIRLGRLDDREITTSLGKRLLMILSPYVFLSTRSDPGPTPSLESNHVSAAYWVPLTSLTGGPQTKWGEMTIDLSSRLAPNRSRWIKFILRSLVGSMRFKSILIPHDPLIRSVPSHPDFHSHPPFTLNPAAMSTSMTRELNLWGLTLGMTLDLLSFFKTDDTLSTPPQSTLVSNVFRSPSLEHLNPPPKEITLVAPSITSIFPRFTHPDINALIWLLGRRYRNLIKQCQQHRLGREDSEGMKPEENNSSVSKKKKKKMKMKNQELESQSSLRVAESGGISLAPTPLMTPTTLTPSTTMVNHKAEGRRDSHQLHPGRMTISYLNNRISWTSLTMKEFYRSVRKALILSVLLRILIFSISLGLVSYRLGPKLIELIRRRWVSLIVLVPFLRDPHHPDPHFRRPSLDLARLYRLQLDRFKSILSRTFV